METENKNAPQAKAPAWHPAVIADAKQGVARSGQPKLFVRVVISEGPAAGRIVDAHIPLGGSERGQALMRGLRKAVGIRDVDPLPGTSQLLAKRVRVRTRPWVGIDGQTREGISAFSPPEQWVSADDDIITITGEEEDAPF